MRTDEQSVNHVLTKACQRLREEDFTGSRLDAEILLAFALKIDRLTLLCSLGRLLKIAEIELYTDFIDRRLACEPLAYIIGKKEFMGLDFFVNSHVLIPRPDTEIVVEKALTLLGSCSGPVVIDVCTGSGCMGLSIAHYCPAAQVFLSDISPAAVEIARKNTRSLALEKRVSLSIGDLLSEFSGHRNIDLICANPPYITEVEFPSLMPDVRCFEPREALVDPGDGVCFHRKLLEQAWPLLKIGGYIVFEIGHKQKNLIEKITHQGYSQVSVTADYAGNDRCAVFQKMG